MDTPVGSISQSVLKIPFGGLLSWGRGAPEGAGKGDISKGGMEIISMAFGENNLALSITEGFTQCPGLAATQGLGHTVG